MNRQQKLDFIRMKAIEAKDREKIHFKFYVRRVTVGDVDTIANNLLEEGCEIVSVYSCGSDLYKDILYKRPVESLKQKEGV